MQQHGRPFPATQLLCQSIFLEINRATSAQFKRLHSDQEQAQPRIFQCRRPSSIHVTLLQSRSSCLARNPQLFVTKIFSIKGWSPVRAKLPVERSATYAAALWAVPGGKSVAGPRYQLSFGARKKSNVRRPWKRHRRGDSRMLPWIVNCAAMPALRADQLA